MILPTIDQTEGIWIARTGDEGYHYIQDVFPKDEAIERAHRQNCRFLIRRGSLQPEHIDYPISHQRAWNEAERYCRVHI